jgi:TolB protein
MRMRVVRTVAVWLVGLTFAFSAQFPVRPVGAQGEGASTGTIAYIKAGGTEIRLIEPDGSGDRPLWAIPNPLQGYNIMDLAWSPDGRELAFASTHEQACSIYDTDIFAIGPQGTGLRRVTNAPACAALAGFPKGTVTVGVQNLTGGGPFFVYVQGAPGVQMATVAPGSTTVVTFNDVADLGSDVQIAVVIEGLNRWIAPIAAADVQPGQTTHAGTIVVTGSGIPDYRANIPSWRSDGTKLGHIFGECAALWQVDSNPPPGSLGAPLLNTTALACLMDYGPTPALANQVLYYSYLDGGIYQVSEGSDDGGTLLVPTDGADFVLDLEWLPDGSGFLYTMTGDGWQNANVYEYTFARGSSLPLTEFDTEFARGVSVAPDGQTIVLDRAPTHSGFDGDLWLINRDGSNPRLLAEDAIVPAWGTGAPVQDEWLYLPMMTR